MSWHTFGTPVVTSTTGLTTNPSTSDLLAEIDSTQLNRIPAGGQNFGVTWIVGGSTNITFQLEHALSTGLGSTAWRDQTLLFTPTNQSAQYVTKLRLEVGDRLRVRVNAGIAAGTAAAKIVAEPLD